MKKVRIKRLMRDKYTGEQYEAGQEIVFEDARADELLNDPRGLAEAVIEEHEQIVGRFDKTQLSGMKIAELKALAEDCGVDVKGLKKAAIIDQLLNVPISTDPEAVLKTEV